MTDSACGAEPGRDELRRSDRRHRDPRVHVRVVEEPEPELDQQEAADRQVEASLGDPALAHEIGEHAGQPLAAQLIAAGVEDRDHPVLG